MSALDALRSCRTPDCQRHAVEDSTLCAACFASLITAAFGPAPVERRERLSESDPFCVAVAEESRRRDAA